MRRIKDYSKHKKTMRIIGVPLIIFGIIICILGFTSFTNGDFDSFGLTAGMYLGGFLMAGIGAMLIFVSFARPVSKYYATEMSPAMQITGESIGTGLKNSGFGNNKTQTKEIIKIKCPHCGYLESEDADFCSKCGKKI